MKKEVLIAILIGFGIGLIITFGIYRAQKAYQQQTDLPTDILQTQETPQPTSAPSFVITSPLNQTVHTQENITIIGTTKPSSYITVVTDDQETVTQADANGNFSLELALSEGANSITVTTLDMEGNKSQQELQLVYISEPTPTESLDTNQTTSQDE